MTEYEAYQEHIRYTHDTLPDRCLLLIALLISPLGLPMLAVWLLGKLQGANAAMKTLSPNKRQAGARLLRLVSKSLFTFLLISIIILARKEWTHDNL